jgi:C-type mannose receptor
VLGPDQASCYRVSEADAVWQSARDQCVTWQGTLVRVDTAEEDEFIGTLVDVSQWLGASDLSLDNTFVWTDGSPVVFGNWGPNQPDRYPGPDCVEKRDGPGRLWFDQPCTNVRAFVCERAITIAP